MILSARHQAKCFIALVSDLHMDWTKLGCFEGEFFRDWRFVRGRNGAKWRVRRLLPASNGGCSIVCSRRKISFVVISSSYR